MIRWCTGKSDSCANPYQQDWTASKRVLNKTRSRVLVVMGVFAVSYLLVCGRMTQLTMENYMTKDEPETPKEAAAIAGMQRADIMDREGHLLATSLKTSSLYADPKIILNPHNGCAEISRNFSGFRLESTRTTLSVKATFRVDQA